jgi:hypothetical protein
LGLKSNFFLSFLFFICCFISLAYKYLFVSARGMQSVRILDQLCCGVDEKHFERVVAAEEPMELFGHSVVVDPCEWCFEHCVCFLM